MNTMRTNLPKLTSLAAPALAGLALAAVAVVAAVGGCEPQESQLTILLVEYKGPEAGPSAERLAEDLKQQNLPGVFVVEGHEYAAVCVGRYATWKDAAAKEMLGRVRRIRDARGQYPFAGVMLMPVPEPPPKTQWPIEEAPGLFSLYVAGWEGPGRKESAQAYASKLRREGWEAYVYHGPRLSMVTIGAFGPDLFDDASRIGLPGATPPEIVHPKALEILRAFPYLRIEDEVTPVRSTAIRIPGREDGGLTGPPIPSRLYRITLSLVSTQTGLAEGRGQVSGVAQHGSEIGPLVEALVEQMLSALGPDERARIGFLEVPAAAGAADPDAGRRATDALAAALAGAAARNSRLVILDPATTRQLLDADALTPDMVRGNARLLKGLTGLQYVVIGTATVSKT